MDATGAGRFTYQYDAARQMSSLRNPYSERTTFGYDDAGRRNVQRNANGTRVSLSYDAASQTTQVFHRTSAGASVLQLDYGYDPAGNRKSMAENATAARTTWTYDKRNQLLGEYRTGTNPYRQTFTYDAAGNRTLKNIDTVRTTYAYDVANQLKYGQAVAGRTSFAYDATGNQRIEQPPTGNRTTTTWNYENQPTQYRLPTGSPVTMSYNGDNRRVVSQQGTSTTKFVWDATTDAYLSELDGANAVQAVYTNEPQHYGSVLSQRRSTTSSILHADALGTTRLLTSSTQTTTDTYLLDAWGNPITSSGTTVNPFRWVGRFGYYQDASTGLVYVRARIYQPILSRWTGLDPAVFLDGPNRYKYVNCNSVLLRDVTGLKVQEYYDPETAVNMPWSDARLHQPNGKVICGNTCKLMELLVDCDKCSTGCSQGYIANVGLVFLTQRIVIDIDAISEANKRISGTYGHEQRHVDKGILIAKGIAKELELKLNDSECITKDGDLQAAYSQCKAIAAEIQKEIYGNWVLTESLNSEHKLDEPIRGRDYPPLGGKLGPTKPASKWVTECIAKVNANLQNPDPEE